MHAGLPSPGIAFAPSFLGRLGRLSARWRALRERREGQGGAHLVGVGSEFVGYRPYTPGDDLRGLDWNLLARFGEAHVRVSRREASERWFIVLDTSASMGVGRPGKLQRAAEVAIAIASLGITEKARVSLVRTSDPKPLRIDRMTDLVAAMRELETWRAQGSEGFSSSFVERVHAGRQFFIGDFLDVEPSFLAGRVGRGREVFALALLAPEEFQPSTRVAAGRQAIWIDAETGARTPLAVDQRGFEAYEEALDRHLESWRTKALRHRAYFRCWSSSVAFERIVEQAFAL